MSDVHVPTAGIDVSAVDPNAAAAAQSAPPAPPPAAGMWQPSQGQMFDPRRKSPLLAAAISVLPGVGQLYIGYYVRGFVTGLAFLAAILLAAASREPLAPAFGMSAMFIWVFNVIDAGRMAALYNHAAAGADVMKMPEDFKLPQMGGSIVGGAVLLAFGGIALSNTAFGYSLDWLEDWWPVFPFALGAYLFARGVMDYTATRSDTAPKFEVEDQGMGIDD